MVINIKIGDFYKEISWTTKYKKSRESNFSFLILYFLFDF